MPGFEAGAGADPTRLAVERQIGYQINDAECFRVLDPDDQDHRHRGVLGREGGDQQAVPLAPEDVQLPARLLRGVGEHRAR
jgi:hypothetical protein